MMPPRKAMSEPARIWQKRSATAEVRVKRGSTEIILAKRTRNAKIISVDPRFTRTSAVADLFCQIRAGSDIAFLGGIIRYAIENKRIAKDYLVNYTNAAFIVKGDIKLPADTDGVFSGFDAKSQSYDKSTWNYAGTGAHPPNGSAQPVPLLPEKVEKVEFDLTLQ